MNIKEAFLSVFNWVKNFIKRHPIISGLLVVVFILFWFIVIIVIVVVIGILLFTQSKKKEKERLDAEKAAATLKEKERLETEKKKADEKKMPGFKAELKAEKETKKQEEKAEKEAKKQEEKLKNNLISQIEQHNIIKDLLVSRSFLGTDSTYYYLKKNLKSLDYDNGTYSFHFNNRIIRTDLKTDKISRILSSQTIKNDLTKSKVPSQNINKFVKYSEEYINRLYTLLLMCISLKKYIIDVKSKESLFPSLKSDDIKLTLVKELEKPNEYDFGVFPKTYDNLNKDGSLK